MFFALLSPLTADSHLLTGSVRSFPPCSLYICKSNTCVVERAKERMMVAVLITEGKVISDVV